jgi:PhnB protein
MEREVKPIPEGYQTATPYLVVRDAARVIEFYKEAFDAEERSREMSPDGKHIIHAEMKIGDSVFMLSDELPGQLCESPLALGGTTFGFYVYVEDVDKAFDRAIAAGGEMRRPVQDMFWGDRTCEVSDPSGHMWTLATHVEELSREELDKRTRESFEKMLQESGLR